MGKTHAYAIAIIGLIIAAGWFLTQRVMDPADRDAGIEADGTGIDGGPAAPGAGDPDAPSSLAVGEDVAYTPEDVEIFRETMEWARANRLDTLELGESMVRMGRRFVGEPYIEQPLELPGEERVVVNLRGFDCVTYVESMLAMGRLVREQRWDDFNGFVEELRRIRYRDGELAGYISRLHYFSEWIVDNEELELMRDITASLGGRPDDEAIDFMSTHAELYPHLDGKPDRIARIEQVERGLSTRTRTYIPQGEIAGVVQGIRNGDIIAATSSVEGLDIAHTGLALWVEGRLHLMHAPLVGKSLEVSEEPLAVRIQGIDGQDGIIVARPL